MRRNDWDYLVAVFVVVVVVLFNTRIGDNYTSWGSFSVHWHAFLVEQCFTLKVAGATCVSGSNKTRRNLKNHSPFPMITFTGATGLLPTHFSLYYIYILPP